MNNISSQIALILVLLLSFTVSGFGLEPVGIKEIHIVTPEWEEQTNKDGTGLFFEIVRMIYEPVGIKIKYEFVPWKRAQKMVSSNRADAMLCVWREHAEEEGQIIPAYPMFVEYTAAVFKKKNITNWNGIKSLDGKRALWLRGYDYHTFSYLKDVRFKKWDEVDEYAQAWGMLAKDRCDVYIDALIDINKYIRNTHVDMTPYSLEILWGEKAYMAFSKTEKSKKFIRIYDKRIMELFKSGELKKIYEKWNVRFSPEAWESK